MRIGIIGAGRWGCTLANLFQRAKKDVRIFCLEEDKERLEISRQIIHTEELFLDIGIMLETDAELLYDCDIVFIAVDGKNLSHSWDQWREYISGTLVLAVKTLDVIDQRLVLPTDLIDYKNMVYFACAAFPEGLLNGAGSPTIGTVYGPDELTSMVKAFFQQDIIRVYTSNDLVGGQIVSALKNVLAIASGIAFGLGLDEMTRAAIVSRGLYEMRRFGSHYGAMPSSFADGSSGLADTIGTCYSHNSHNFLVGVRIGCGSYDEKGSEYQIGTAEGVRTAGKLRELPHDQKQLMPIASAVAKIIFDGVDPRVAMKELMGRPLS